MKNIVLYSSLLYLSFLCIPKVYAQIENFPQFTEDQQTHVFYFDDKDCKGDKWWLNDSGTMLYYPGNLTKNHIWKRDKNKSSGNVHWVKDGNDEFDSMLIRNSDGFLPAGTKIGIYDDSSCDPDKDDYAIVTLKEASRGHNMCITTFEQTHDGEYFTIDNPTANSTKTTITIFATESTGFVGGVKHLVTSIANFGTSLNNLDGKVSCVKITLP